MTAPTVNVELCLVKGCGVVVMKTLLTCPAHWTLIPAALRRDLLAEHKATGATA